MSLERVEAFTYFRQTVETMRRHGLLLVGAKPDGSANVMTIGWGTIGIIWGRPIFTVLVRPSRYTYEFLEALPEFTVNVPTPELADTVQYCGSVSGRDHDKFAERGLTRVEAREVSVPVVGECAIHYECRIVHRNDVLPPQLADEVKYSAYSSGDYHRIYDGEIVCVTADPAAVERLPEG